MSICSSETSKAKKVYGTTKSGANLTILSITFQDTLTEGKRIKAMALRYLRRHIS